jgi:isoquinoline 1-oxidoreductase subunit alpha
LPNHYFIEEVIMIDITVNKKDYVIDAAPSTPLLWVIRDFIGLTGTKFGCGIAQCGVCTVHLNGKAVRSCVTTISQAKGQHITTIEGLSDDVSERLRQAWASEGVVQCGYCQSGQIMSAAMLLSEIPNPADSDIDKAMSGNVCRCGTYQRIRKAIHLAATK